METMLKLSEISTWGLPKLLGEIFYILIGIIKFHIFHKQIKVY